MKTLRILALDPGTHDVGWASVDFVGTWPPKLIDSGVITAGGETLHGRLASIDHKVRRLAKRIRPKQIAIEGGYVGFGKNRNPPGQLALAEARGVIKVAAGGGGIPVKVYSPSEVKKAATGNGRAEKDLVMRFVQEVYKLPGLPMADQADALAVALCHAKYLEARAIRRRAR